MTCIPLSSIKIYHIVNDNIFIQFFFFHFLNRLSHTVTYIALSRKLPSGHGAGLISPY